MSRLALATPSRARFLLAVPLLVAASACATKKPSFLPPSRPAEFSLAGVPWSISADSVTSLIEPRGYNLNRVDEDGDLWFDGVLFHSPTRLFAFMGEQRLVRLRVVINTPDQDALSTYQRARAELVKQYGAPRETTEEFQAPYAKGDSKELEAIRAGKANIRTYWLPREGARTSHVSVYVTDDLVVVVDYDGPAWSTQAVTAPTPAPASVQ